MILTINATVTPGEHEDLALLPAEPDDIMKQLLQRGYTQITLCGLGKLGARLRDGRICDAIPLLVEEDAAFLAEGCRSAERVIREEQPAKHWIHLDDGCFEIVAHLFDDRVRMRLGEFEGAFDPSSGEGVTLSVANFLSFWRSISKQLAEATGC